MATDPMRIPGPTPNGGAYAIAYQHDNGVEIVEFDAANREIMRTYSRRRPGRQAHKNPARRERGARGHS
jgi:hypothetical protein